MEVMVHYFEDNLRHLLELCGFLSFQVYKRMGF